MALPEGSGPDGAASRLREVVDGLMEKYDRGVDGALDACRRGLVRDLLLEGASGALDLRMSENMGALLEGQLRIEEQLDQVQAGLLESGFVRVRSLEEHSHSLARRTRSRFGLGRDDVAEPSSLQELHSTRSRSFLARDDGAEPPLLEEKPQRMRSKSTLARDDSLEPEREEPREPSKEAAAAQPSFSLGEGRSSRNEEMAEEGEVHPNLTSAGSRSYSVTRRVSIARSTTTHRQSWRDSIGLRPELQGSDEQLDQICQDGVASVTMRSARALTLSFAGGHKTGAGMMRRHTSERSSTAPFFVMAPGSPRRLLVDVFSIAVLFYDAVSLPYQLAWEVPQEGMVLYLACASCCYWVLDMLAHFRTGFYLDGNLMMEPTRIARRYLASTFLLDAATITADAIALVLQLQDTRMGGSPSVVRFARVLKISRVARLIGILRMWSLAQVLDRLYLHSTVLHASSVFILDTVAFASIILWLNHVMACIWFALGTREDHDTGITWLHTDGGNGRAYADESPQYQYSTSLHWSITQMTPGSMQVFPVNSEERQFNILCLMAGLVIFSFLISSISAAVAQFKIRVHQHTEKLETVRRFLRETHVSSQLALAVNKQVVQKLNARRPLTANDVDVMKLLSLSIQSALMMELCFPILGMHAFFRFLLEMDRSVAEELCRSCSNFVTVAKTDTVFLAGGDALGMYFVVSGDLTYTLAQDRRADPDTSPSERKAKWEQVLPVERGEWLCEAALWCRWRHAGTAENREASFCELLSVRSAALLQLVKRQALMNSLVWAYARRFCALLQDSEHVGCSRPNDVTTQFGVDEVLLSMPHSAKVYLGQFTLNFMLTSRGWLGSWFSHEGQVEALQSEVDQGKSFLIISMSKPKGDKVLRVVSLAALRLRRPDGRCLARLSLESRPNGQVEVSCKLPGASARNGESRDMMVNRLLEQQLEPVKEQILVDSYEITHETKFSDRLHVHTRYIKLMVHATWLEGVEAMPFEGTPVASSLSYATGTASRSVPTLSGITALARSAGVASSEGSNVPSSLLEVPVFRIMSGHFAWLHDHEIAHYSKPAGEAELKEWLSSIPSISADEGLRDAPSAPR